jgi:tRNA(Ile)-lysidine synthase
LRLPTFVAAVDRALQSVGGPGTGEGLVVGLSGGADSVALLDALVMLRERRGFRSVGAHLDHRLRPESVDDVTFCRSLCENLAVPFHTASADVRSRARRERGGLEQAARRERYRFLHRVRKETGAVAIAVAHTRDDQAETLLLRLLRGAGATGLGGMRPRRGLILRPLLGISREQVVSYLGERGLAWREDVTNLDLDLQRNRVRHELMPYLEARFNPSLRRGLARTAGLLADEAAHLRNEADELLDQISHADGEEIVLDRIALAEVPPALGRVAVRQALRRAGGLARVGAIHVESVLALARSPAPSGRLLPLPGGRQVRYRHDEVRLGPRLPVAAGGAELGREP